MTKEEAREARRRYREKHRAHINALAAKYRQQEREKREARKTHGGEPNIGYTNLCSGSCMTVHWQPRRVKVVSGWRGQRVAGGGPKNFGF